MVGFLRHPSGTLVWLDKDFAGENREKVLGADLRRAPLHWVLPNETLGLLNGLCPWGLVMLCFLAGKASWSKHTHTYIYIIIYIYDHICAYHIYLLADWWTPRCDRKVLYSIKYYALLLYTVYICVNYVEDRHQDGEENHMSKKFVVSCWTSCWNCFEVQQGSPTEDEQVVEFGGWARAQGLHVVWLKWKATFTFAPI